MTARTSPSMMSSPLPSTSETREEQAHALCLRLLTARSRTRSELAGQLAKRGYADDVATTVLDRLTTVGLIDDADFRRAVGALPADPCRQSKRALAAELPHQRVSTTRSSPARSGDRCGCRTGARRELVQRKLRRNVATADDAKVMRRLVGMLARRGYNMAVAVVGDALAARRERRRV